MISVTFDLQDLDQKLERAAASLEELPADPGQNPCALALYDYQAELANADRPTVGTSGDVKGVTWPALAPQYVRRDGTVVPVYGGVPYARGRGTVQGKLKSEGVARGSGSRYRSDDRQLGARAGGLWSSWITQRAAVAARGLAASLTSAFAYSARQFARRPWWSGQLASFTENRLELRSTDYINGVLRREGLA